MIQLAYLLLGAARAYWPALVIAAVCAAWGAHVVVLDGRLKDARAAAAQARAQLAQERAERERVAREAEQAYRDREQEMVARLEQVKEQAHEQVQRAARDAADARAAAERLRVAAIRAARAAGGGAAAADPAAAAGGETTAGPGLVLADLLGRCGARLVELAEHADRSRAAGAACELAYDALRSGWSGAAPAER